jgi:hypothetical protein
MCADVIRKRRVNQVKDASKECAKQTEAEGAMDAVFGMGKTHDWALDLVPLALPPDLPPVILKLVVFGVVFGWWLSWVR